MNTQYSQYITPNKIYNKNVIYNNKTKDKRNKNINDLYIKLN